MPNSFPARDRAFITKLAEDLHLSITWDEYDADDQNLVSWRFPGALEEPLPEGEVNPAEEDGDEWEDEDDEESNQAVDRVLAKYTKAKVMTDDADGDFDARYEAAITEKMDEWKRGYYQVSHVWSSHKWYVPNPYVGQAGF
jgi:5'-3' exoribonuclease 1